MPTLGDTPLNHLVRWVLYLISDKAQTLLWSSLNPIEINSLAWESTQILHSFSILHNERKMYVL